MYISEDVLYVGVNDHKIDLFEGQYQVPNGMSYNSYVILDQKVAVLDTVDQGFKEEWLENLKVTLHGRTPDYLIVSHMEPDHCANIVSFTEMYPSAVIVGNSKTFAMMEQFFRDLDFKSRMLLVSDGQTLSLGKHQLTFVFAPMVHWPEVMVTYDSTEKILFSADAFGTFGALDVNQEWLEEARRYYIGIVGKYGAPVQTLLKKAANLDIHMICPLHGPVLKDNLGYYIDKYQTWSSYQPETKGIMIAYDSVYGHTKEAALLLESYLKENPTTHVLTCDLARTDLSWAVAKAFEYETLVLASITYNADIFVHMKHLIEHLTERNYQNRTVGLIENGSWAPTAARVMKTMLEKSKNINIVEPVVVIRSSVSDENREQLRQLALHLTKE